MSVQKTQTQLEGALARRPTPPPGLRAVSGFQEPQSRPQINPVAAALGTLLGGAPGAVAGISGFQAGQAQAKSAAEKAAALRVAAEAKAQRQAGEQYKQDRTGWLDELSGLKTAHLFDEDEADREAKAGDREDKATKDAAAVTRQDKLDAAREVTEKRLSKSSILRDMLSIGTPEGQGAYLKLIGPEALAQSGLTVPRLKNEDGSEGEYDLSAFQGVHKEKPAALSPEALAARAEVEKVQIGHKAGLQTMTLFSKMATDPRVKGPAQKELHKRIGIIADSLQKGEAIPAWVYKMEDSPLADMSPVQKRGAEAKDRAGDQKDRALTETERKNKAQERQALANAAQRAREALSRTEKAGNAPGARFQAAQSEYAQLRDYYSKLMSHEVPTVDKQAHGEAVKSALRRLGELESRHPVLGKGWGAGDLATRP